MIVGDRVVSKRDRTYTGTAKCFHNGKVMIQFDKPVPPYTSNLWGIWCNKEAFEVLVS